jgi:splicing factor 3B subunit 1
LQRAYQEQLKAKAKEGTLTTNGNAAAAAKAQPAKRRRWDVAGTPSAEEAPPSKQAKSSWDTVEATTPSQSRWDETPGRSKGGETPGATPGASTRQWDITPGHASSGAATPGRDTPGQMVTPSARRNRWDETPKTDRGTFVLAVDS